MRAFQPFVLYLVVNCLSAVWTRSALKWWHTHFIVAVFLVSTNWKAFRTGFRKKMINQRLGWILSLLKMCIFHSCELFIAQLSFEVLKPCPESWTLSASAGYEAWRWGHWLLPGGWCSACQALHVAPEVLLPSTSFTLAGSHGACWPILVVSLAGNNTSLMLYIVCSLPGFTSEK